MRKGGGGDSYLTDNKKIPVKTRRCRYQGNGLLLLATGSSLLGGLGDLSGILFGLVDGLDNTDGNSLEMDWMRIGRGGILPDAYHEQRNAQEEGIR